MSPTLGNINYSIEEGYQKSFSEKTGKLIDEEVKNLIDMCYEMSKALLTEKKDLIEKLAEALLK